jgi:rhodanese-related sulfurtransferase
VPPSPNSGARSSPWPQAGLLLLVAALLGAAYNAVSPLGLRVERAQGGPASAGEPLPVAWLQVKPSVGAGKVLLVDAGESSFFEARHIPGAVSLPFGELAARMPAFAARFPKSQPIVVYCASASCPVAHDEAVVLAARYGFRDVREMPGGYAEWRLAESQAGGAGGGSP